MLQVFGNLIVIELRFWHGLDIHYKISFNRGAASNIVQLSAVFRDG